MTHEDGCAILGEDQVVVALVAEKEACPPFARLGVGTGCLVAERLVGRHFVRGRPDLCRSHGCAESEQCRDDEGSHRQSFPVSVCISGSSTSGRCSRAYGTRTRYAHKRDSGGCRVSPDLPPQSVEIVFVKTVA
jgi:hypothetical protein